MTEARIERREYRKPILLKSRVLLQSVVAQSTSPVPGGTDPNGSNV